MKKMVAIIFGVCLFGQVQAESVEDRIANQQLDKMIIAHKCMHYNNYVNNISESGRLNGIVLDQAKAVAPYFRKHILKTSGYDNWLPQYKVKYGSMINDENYSAGFLMALVANENDEILKRELYSYPNPTQEEVQRLIRDNGCRLLK